MTVDKKEVIDALHKGVVVVSFTKKDGSNRDMKCTLNSLYFDSKELIPREQTDSLTYQRVYDVELGAWRSFIWDNVKSCQLDLLS